MPPIRSTASKRCTLLTISISLDGKIISPYSYYAKKGLVYITITDSSSCQPFLYTKCTKLNTYSSYNMRLVSLNKYIFPAYSTSLRSLQLP